MGEIMEINFICKKQISCHILFDLFTSYINKGYKIDEIEVIDNWEYENIININDENKIYDYINNGKIVNINANISSINIGLQLELLEEKYIGNIWIDTNSFNFNELKSLLKYFLSKLDVLFLIFDFKTVAIGLETYFEPYDDCEKMMSMSHDIIYWMFSKNSYFSDNYQLLELENSIVINSDNNYKTI